LSVTNLSFTPTVEQDGWANQSSSNDKPLRCQK
jgi:hypothetical protein